MKPLEITLTDTLRDALADAMRSTDAYKKTVRGRKDEALNQRNFQRLRDALRFGEDRAYAGVMEKLAACLNSFSEPRLQQEAQGLHDALRGAGSGYATPVVLVKNLPKGIDGALLHGALSTLASGETPILNYRHNKILAGDNRDAQDLLFMRRLQMHRDSGGHAVMRGLLGSDVGVKPLTTTCADVNEFIDEVARHYRQARTGESLTAPLDEATRNKVRGLLTTPEYFIKYRDRNMLQDGVTGPAALLVPDANAKEGAAWPTPWRFHKYFARCEHALEHLKHTGTSLESRFIAQAVADAGDTLKLKDGIVVGPGEGLYFNNSFVLHSAGRFVDDKRARLFGVRSILDTSAFAPNGAVEHQGYFEAPDLMAQSRERA